MSWEAFSLINFLWSTVTPINNLKYIFYLFFYLSIYCSVFYLRLPDLMLFLQVALKTLTVIHRALREVDPTFREELINYGRNRGHILNMAHFKDDSSANGIACLEFCWAITWKMKLMTLDIFLSLAWDYSSWVRTYALFLEERLECYRVLKYDVETDPPVSILF